MANYIMSTTLIPKKSLAQINQCQAQFWWVKLCNKSCRWISWDQIFKPLRLGGLGIRNMHTMNLARVLLSTLTVSAYFALNQNLADDASPLLSSN